MSIFPEYNFNKYVASSPGCEFATMTPALVAWLLSRNINNRRVRSSHVSFLMEQFKNYVPISSGIGIDVDGEVIDGQHRLIALQKTGFPPVLMLIVYGLPKESKAVIDQGIRRTMADIFRFAFERPDANSIVISACRVWGIERMGLVGSARKPTAIQMLEWYEALSPAAFKILEIVGSSRLPAPVIAALAARIWAYNDADCVLTFTRDLVTGAGLSQGSPALTLRNWLLSQKKGGGPAQQLERFQKTEKAINAYAEGRTLSKLYGSKRAASRGGGA